MQLPLQKQERTSTRLPLVASLPWGSHCCLLYRFKSDLYDAATEFFRAGLENGEKCVWILSPGHEGRSALAARIEDLARYEQQGRIEILERTDWYAGAEAFDAEGVQKVWLEYEHRALDEGFNGLRISGDAAALDRRAWRTFLEYEASVEETFRGRLIVALCTYSLAECSFDDILEVAAHHETVLVRDDGRWQSLRNMTRLANLERRPNAKDTICFFDPADEHPENIELWNIEGGAERRRLRLAALQAIAAGLGKSLSVEEILAVVKRVAFETSEVIIQRDDTTEAAGQNRSAAAGRQRRAEWLTDEAEIGRRYPALADAAALGVFPLTVGARDFGTMLLAFDSATLLDAEEWSFLQGLAQLTAIAFEQAELRETADREERLRDELVATLSHELRNPLATIAAVAEALRVVADDRVERTRWEAALRRQVEQMDNLLAEMLDFSRFAKLEMSEERFDVAAVLLRAVEDKRIESERRGLTVNLDLEGHRVKGSEMRLTQVFHNLLANSIKFTDPPGEIAVSCRSDPDGNAVITFKDTGIGIEASLLPRIFDPFTQGARQATESGGSLGLGLAVVKRIVGQHGGTVSAHSAGRGKGTTFTIVLPPTD